MHTGNARRVGPFLRDVGSIVTGSLLFSISINWIVLPTGMYSGGFLGLAQLLRMGFLQVFPTLPGNADLTGLIYLILNVPLLIIAWSRFGRLFLAKTVLCVCCYSLFLSIIPTSHASLFDEYLTACIVGGLVCGAGAGLTLTAGCSGGGEEIIGLLCARKNPDFSVGRVSMLLNIFIFGAGFLLFDRQVVVYSIMFAGVSFFCLDRMHLQNVMVTMMIITKEPAMEQMVFAHAGRGVTKWRGEGAYSSKETDILLTVVSKREALALRRLLRQSDPNIFVIINEDILVVGNFQKRI